MSEEKENRTNQIKKEIKDISRSIKHMTAGILQFKAKRMHLELELSILEEEKKEENNEN